MAPPNTPSPQDQWMSHPSIGVNAGNYPPGGQGGGSTWTAPPDLVPTDNTADNSADACRILVDIQTCLDEWRSIGYAQEFALVDKGIKKQLSALTGSRPLTANEVTVLTGIGLMAVQTRKDALQNLVNAITTELAKYTGESTQTAIDTASELLHQQFMRGDGGNKIEELNELVGKAKEFSEEIKKYVDYAQKTASFIKAAAKLKDVSEGLEKFKGKMAEVQKALDLASDIATLAGKVNQKPSDTANSISQIRAGLRIADFIMSKTSVPVIGQWWSGYIKPCAELALNQLEKLDEMIDKSERGLLADQWWEQASKGMKAPVITDSGLNGVLLAKLFPGGQPMLDFMWSLFRGGAPSSVPDAVKKHMLKYRKQFNAGMSEDDQLKTDAAWYNAWDLFSDEDSPNILQWVTKNKETVWSMEYGSLPHP